MSKYRFVQVACIIALLAATPVSLLARGGSGSSSGSTGGGRSSFSSSGGTRGASSAGSSWKSGPSSASGSSGSSAPSIAPAPARSWGSSSSSGSANPAPSRSGASSSSSSSGWGSSSRFSNTPDQASAAPASGSGGRTDSALARKSGENGRSFSSRADAVKDFEATHAAKYPSSYAREPATRPEHIPQTVLIDNRSYPVYYDPTRGSYGYRDSSGWRTYEVVRDAVMLGALMQHHNYNYDGGYGAYAPGYAPGYVSHHSFLGSLVGLLCIVILVGGAIFVLRIIF